MNERIRELAGQSVVRFDKDMDGSMELEEQGRWVRYEDLEKFAELIVRECADTAFLEANSRKVQRAVLQHFGVEA